MANPAAIKHSALGLLATVALVALGLRAWLWLTYQPVSYSDTNSYRRLADAILKPQWKGYDGTRTPGYPLMLAILGPDERVYLTQLVMGVAITLLLFYIGWQISGKVWFGAACALVHTLNLGQLFFEANLLTETPTTFWIMLSLAGVAFWHAHPNHRSAWLACGLGLASTAAAFTRPLFIYLPFWVLLFLWLDGKRPKLNLRIARQTLALLLPVILAFGAWVSFIHSRFNDWALTTMTGYHMVQHTGNTFEYVPDEYAGLRDTYIKYRDAQVAQHGTPANAIWDAIPEMTRVSGMTFYDLNRTLARISTRLILEHPDLFLRNCLEGWWMFWRAPVYWSAESFQWPGFAEIMRPLIWLERLVLSMINVLFIFLSLLAVVLAICPRAGKLRLGGGLVRLRLIGREPSAFLWCLASTIWIASILQTLLDHGDNPRFLVPLQSLVVIWVLWFGWRWVAIGKHPAP